jgi:glycosyltransferase involved in cell wall biosynthesis
VKVLLVVPDYPPKSSAGGGRVAKILAEGLQNIGNEVTVLAGYYDSIEKNQYEEIVNGVKIIWVPLMDLFLKSTPQLIYSLPPRLSSLKFLISFDYTRYDIIHLFAYPTHLFVDIIALVSKNKKFILTIHAFPQYVDGEGPASTILKTIYHVYLLIMGRYMVKNCKIITSISVQTKRDAIEHNFPHKKIILVPNGIYLKKFDLIDAFDKRYFGITKDEFLVTSIGRITWHKGFEYALIGIKKASEDITNLKYIIIGEIVDHDYFIKLKDIVRNYDLSNNVIFAGYVNEEAKLHILSRSDIYLAPSLHEGFGLTLLEAMKCRTPIVATRTAGHNDVVKHMETAVMVETKNSSDIENSIKLLHKDKELREKLVYNAMMAVENYDWDNIILKYESIYKFIK